MADLFALKGILMRFFGDLFARANKLMKSNNAREDMSSVFLCKKVQQNLMIL
jgi:hypothetical protein